MENLIQINKLGYYGFDKFDGKDDRSEGWKKQRIERGFDNTELWSLGDTIVNFTIPRLKEFIEIEREINADFNEYEKDYLDFLEGLELFVRNEGNRIWNDEEKIKVEKSLNDFGDFLPSLWY